MTYRELEDQYEEMCELRRRYRSLGMDTDMLDMMLEDQENKLLIAAQEKEKDGITNTISRNR